MKNFDKKSKALRIVIYTVFRALAPINKIEPTLENLINQGLKASVNDYKEAIKEFEPHRHTYSSFFYNCKRIEKTLLIFTVNERKIINKKLNLVFKAIDKKRSMIIRMASKQGLNTRDYLNIENK